MSFGNLPVDELAGAAEKLLANMDEADLAAVYEREFSTMPSDAYEAFIEAVFEAFRERGESSEDAAEGAGETVESIAQRENGAAGALLVYARTNPELLKEATVLFVSKRPELITALPAAFRDALAERLTRSRP